MAQKRTLRQRSDAHRFPPPRAQRATAAGVKGGEQVPALLSDVAVLSHRVVAPEPARVAAGGAALIAPSFPRQWAMAAPVAQVAESRLARALARVRHQSRASR